MGHFFQENLRGKLKLDYLLRGCPAEIASGRASDEGKVAVRVGFEPTEPF